MLITSLTPLLLVFLSTRVQRVTAEFAAFLNSHIVVPIYENISPADYKHIMLESEYLPPTRDRQ